MNAYFIPGLGADEKLFQRVVLPEHFSKIFINWNTPLQNESFESYARRLFQNIDTNKEFILIGVSLGGMMAVEASKFISPAKTILISSAVNRHELPRFSRFLGKLGIADIIPEKIYRSINFYGKYFLGINSSEDEALATSMLPNASIDFFKWAIPNIVRWKNSFIPAELVRIHGTKDRVIPFPKNKNIIPVKDGSHFMIFNKADEVNTILSEILL